MTAKKYHTNEHGETGICPAKIQCRLKDVFGSPVKHYASVEEAHAAYENLLEKKEGLTATLTKDDVLSVENRTVENSINTMKDTEKVILDTILARDFELRKMSEKQERLLKDAVDKRQPLPESIYKEREQYIERITQEFPDSEELYAKNPEDIEKGYTREREALHNDIINSFLQKYSDVKREEKVLLAGGLAGAGKSTVLNQYLDIKEQDYATLNPDDIKEGMAKRGMIPDIPGLTPMESSPIVHEEASYITNRLQDVFAASNMNILFDTTLSSTESAEDKIEGLLDQGYEVSNISGVFIDISPDTALPRTKARYRIGMNDYTTSGGKGVGGRYLPKRIIDEQRTNDNSFYHSKNAENFIKLKESEVFNAAQVFDNNGKDPKEIPYEEFLKSGTCEV